MPSQRILIRPNDQLHIGSKYLRYHIKMYVETFLWLQDHLSFTEWDTERNAILEDHQIHTRILINFLSSVRRQKEDILAIDYFHDLPDIFHPLQDDFLSGQAQRIAGNLVHITTKPMPKLKSEQEWPITETSSKLVPAIKSFLNIVPENRLADDVKNDCLQHLARLFPPTVHVAVSAST